VERLILFQVGEVWTIEDEKCQKIGGGQQAAKFRFFAVSLNRADTVS